jgi:dTDP-4-dehydrorhamnose 3,5-epimerase
MERRELNFMKIVPTPLNGLYQIDAEPKRDQRGFFARAFCERVFAEHGLETAYVQANISMNYLPGTIRGLHLQRLPSAEVKLVRCIAGTVYDVAVDLRPESPTFQQWFAAELSADNSRCLYIPHGFAHGFQSLTPNATLYYMVSAFHDPVQEFGLRYDDPAIGIQWPMAVGEVSQKDSDWPLFDPHSYANS